MSDYSKYHSFRPNIISLNDHEVQQLKNALTKNFLEKRLEEANQKQQKIDDLYNMFQ